MEIIVIGSALVGEAACLWVGDTTEGWGMVLDCGVSVVDGMVPDLKFLRDLPVDVLLVTHAHLDHIGALPLFVQEYPNVPVLASHGTRLCAGMMLMDAAKVAARRRGEKASLFSDMIALEAARRLLPLHVGREVKVGPLRITAWSAGHIPGSVWYEIKTPVGLRVVYTGDINHVSLKSCQALDRPLGGVDLLISEATYGNQIFPSRKVVEREFIKEVRDTLARGGRVLIPAFALGRAQEIVRLLITAGIGEPIYVAGLAADVTLLLESMTRVDSKLQKIMETQGTVFRGKNIVYLKGGKGLPSLLQDRFPCVVVASSGMLLGGPSKRVSSVVLREKSSTILFTGYLDPDSPGAKLMDKSSAVECEVVQMNLSAHADAGGLLQFVRQSGTQVVVLTHGTFTSISAFKASLEERGVEACSLLETPRIAFEREALLKA